MMKKFNIFLLVLTLCLLFGTFQPAAVKAAQAESGNPFFQTQRTPFGVPSFDRIKNSHFLPAIEEGIKRQLAEIKTITVSHQAANFANTIEAFDASGEFLANVTAVFFTLQGSNTNEELQKLAQRTAPLLAAHRDNINLDEKLFRRIKEVYDKRQNLNLSQEQLYLLENTFKNFVRTGALLDAGQKERLRAINRELSLLGVQFGDNLLAETNGFRLVIDERSDLVGLPPAAVSAAEEAAKQAGLPGKWVFDLQASSMTPFLQYSPQRTLREKLYRAYCMRADHGDSQDNKEIIDKIVSLRSERARLLGYPSHAHFVLETNMAKNPETVNAFLNRLWIPALARARQELLELQVIADREQAGFRVAAWDWWFYSEKLRQEKYSLDDTGLRPYFELNNVRQGIFTLCDKLYGLKFVEQPGLPRYLPEVQVFEVREDDGRHVGILYLDFFLRAGKRSGAWSGGLRRQFYQNKKRIPPIATINCNFTHPAAGTPSLLSLEEVRTFFHEFGHALATLLADGRYRSRSIARDSGELPSQIMEHWAREPELLALYARHYQTGAVIPAELAQKIRNSQLFNQGFITVEYLAACILDMAYHTIGTPWPIDVITFENALFGCIGLMPEIAPRYHSTYFSHIFSGGGGYSAGYYNYIWSAVLDSDAYEAFKEKGIFDKATALSFRRNILAPFGTDDIMKQYVRFRGAEPHLEPLLKNRGLSEEQK